VYDELVLSYSLIFSRDHESRKLARRLFAPTKVTFVGPYDRPPVGTIVITKWNMYFGGQSPGLAHFPHYSGHFALLHKQMLEWNPHKWKDLFEPGYRNRFMYWATLLGVLIASVGIAGVIMSIISAVTGFISMKVALRGFQLQEVQHNPPVR
jgi:hypothetical protein